MCVSRDERCILSLGRPDERTAPRKSELFLLQPLHTSSPRFGMMSRCITSSSMTLASRCCNIGSTRKDLLYSAC